jgi:protein-tyrosine phosphatase
MQHVYWVIEKRLAGRPGPTRFPWDPAELYTAGFRVVISLATEVGVDDLTTYGLTHYRADFPPLSLFSVGMRKAFIHQALPVWAFIHEQLEAESPTLVHCFAGKDRTGAILAGYLVVYGGLTPEAAIQKVRAVNPEAMTAPGFEDAIRLLQPGTLPDPKTLL